MKLSLLKYRNRQFAMISLALVLSLFMTKPLFAAPHDHDEAEHASSSAGPNGGELTQEGKDSLEIGMIEEGGAARLVLWASSDGKPLLAEEVNAKAVLTRPDSETQTLTLRPDGKTLKSIESIAEPHFFEVEVQAQWPGRPTPMTASFHKEEGLIALTAEQIALAGLEISEVGAANLAVSASFPGEIKFNADRTANVTPRVSGTVQQVSADLGQLVKKGDILATISSPGVSDLRSEWLSASRRRDLAASTFRREQKLWKEQVTAEQDYQQARTALQEADIAVQNAAQKLGSIGATPSSKELSVIEIRAPFDGVIVEKNIVLGEALADTVNIFTISDLSTVWAEFVIAPKDIPYVRVGEDALVRSTSFAGEAPGRVSYIASLVGQQTRTAAARVVLENPDMAWRPGLFVTVEVIVDRNDVALAVDSDSVLTIDEEPVVFIEVPEGFVAQPVKLGKSSSDSVEILAGLKPGMRYVSSNAFVLKSEMGKAAADHAH